MVRTQNGSSKELPFDLKLIGEIIRQNYLSKLFAKIIRLWFQLWFSCHR